MKILGIPILIEKPHFNLKEWFQSWKIAIKNSIKGSSTLFKNKRFWIGLIISILVHGGIFFYSWTLAHRADQSSEIIESITMDAKKHPDKYRPRPVKNTQTPPPEKVSTTADQNVVAKDYNEEELFKSAQIENMDIDMSDEGLEHGLLVINPDASISTENLLDVAPVAGDQSLEESSFDPFASEGVSGIDVSNDIGVTDIASHTNTNESDIGDINTSTTTTASQSSGGFTIQGDLTRGDILSYFLPRYSKKAARDMWQGQAVVDFDVNASGAVIPSSIRLTQPTNYRGIDNSIISNLKRWRFKAVGQAKRHGRIVFSFRLG